MKEFCAGRMGPNLNSKDPFRERVRTDWPQKALPVRGSYPVKLLLAFEINRRHNP